MRRRRPLLHPRSAPPAPSGTTSAAPTRTPGTRPLGNHPSSAPGRTATGARSRGAGTPGPRTSAPASVLSARLEPLGQPAAQDRLDRAVADGRQPACRRPATGRRRRTPHSRAPSGPPDPATGTPTTPTAAAGPPPDRVQLVHQRHQVRKPFNRGLRRPCLRLRRRAAPGTPPPRTAPAAVAPRPPRPSSRRGTRRRRPPRARTARDRGPLTRQRRSDTILPSGQSRFRPAPTCRSARRNVPSRRSPGPGPRGSLTRSTTPASPHRARRAATSSASASRSASSISSRRMRSTMKHKSPFRPPDPQRIEWQPGLRSTLDVRAGERRPRSPDTPPAAAAGHRSRTASGSPGTAPPPSPAVPETPPADAPPAAAARSPFHH